MKRKSRTKYMSMFLTILMVLSLLPVQAIQAVEFEGTEEGLVAHYDMTASESKLIDVTNNGFDADYVGFEEGDFVEENSEAILNFTGDPSKYVELPQGLIEDETFTIETTFSTSTEANHWLYNLGTQRADWPNVTNYVFFNPKQQGGNVRFGLKDAENEVLFQEATLADGEYHTFTASFAEGIVSYYINGEFTGETTHTYSIIDILDEGVDADSDYIGFIGRSLYNPDPAFTGNLADFKVYNYALTEEDINEVNVTGVSLDQETITLTEGETVQLGVTVTPEDATNKGVEWTSSDENIVAVDDSGNITAQNTGSAQIIVTTIDGGYSATSVVSVEKPSPPLSAENILHYDMKTTEENSGQPIIKDVSGSEVSFDGAFKNPENGQLVQNDDVGYVGFDGGSSNSNSGYIEIPKGTDGEDLLNGIEDVTVSTLVNWDNDGQNRWIFGLGRVDSDIEYGNGYFFVTPRHGISNSNVAATGISDSGWRGETLIRSTESLQERDWEVVTVVFSGSSDSLTLYVNGEEVASGSAGGQALENIIDLSSDFSGFIGKSIFGNDPYFKGMIGDFRVYDGALTDEEVEFLYDETAEKVDLIGELVINDAKDSLNISDYLAAGDENIDEITRNLALPTIGKHGVKIAWTSSDSDVIQDDGTVIRPGVNDSDATVDLTATLSYAGFTSEKMFSVVVLKEFGDQQRADLDAANIVIYNQDQVKGNLRLPITGEHGSTITWESSNPEIIKGSEEAGDDDLKLGWVTRPDADTAVKLTATVSKGAEQTEKIFDVQVLEAPGEIDYDAYFFSYFTGEYEGGEEISFATAEDPLNWRALNNGQSVIQSTMGEEGLRDPFIMRSPEGDKFYMIATDLKMGESTNFDQAQITGSHSLMIWESDDLVNWSDQRMVEVAPENGGNTWAPEAWYHEPTGEYVVFWASSMKNEDTYGDYPNGRPSGQYNVMYYATTRDFHTFSEPKVMIDEGFPTIDVSFIENEGTLYRFTKSEVGFKVYYEKADDFYYDADGIVDNGFQFEPVPGTRDGNRGLIGHGGNNEGQTIFKDIHSDEDKWYLFLDSWPYHVRWTDDLEDGQQLVNNLIEDSGYALPPGPRHGTVMPITRAEYDALQEEYALPAPEASGEPVVHYSFNPEDVEGTTVKDISGNGFDAQLIGGAEITTEDTVGESVGAVELDGETGYVELPENLISDLDLESMTMSTWVKVKGNQANQRIFDFSSETGRNVNRNTMYLSTQGDSGNLEFAIVTPFTEKFSNQNTLLGSNYKYALRDSRISTNQWQHIAITIEGFDAVMYLNGEEVSRSSTYNVEPRMLLETTMNYLGKSRRDSHNLFDGIFDEFQVYNRALSSGEIKTLADEEFINPIEEPGDGDKILHYEMNNIDGTTVPDTTGNYDADWINPENSEWIRGENTGAISFDGGTTSSYIEMPEGVLDGLESVTVSSLVNWKGNNQAEWIFALGQDSDKYFYVTPSRNSGNNSARLGLGITSWQNEAAANGTTGTLDSDNWKVVTAVMDGEEETLTLYIDGVEVGTGSTNGYTLEEINNANGRSGFIGRSFYASDPYFGGMIADFQVYNDALSASEVSDLQEGMDEKIAEMNGFILEYVANQLDYEFFMNNNENKDELTSHLLFHTSGDYDTSLTWESSNQDIISNDGTVTRPSYEEGSQEVVITVTISDGTNSVEKEFTVTVFRLPTDSEAMINDAKDLKVYNINDVRGNLTLPTTGENGSTITWDTADSSVITTTGEVYRPAYGSGDVTVRLNATITLNDELITKSFLATVKEMPEKVDYEGYLFSYMRGEGRSDGEQIFFSLSEGNDPLNYQALNNNNPAIISELGEEGLRDPFIIRSPEGDKFYMIATDLRIYGNHDWHRAQTRGSRSIMVWESTDLINWSEQRMAEVAPSEAGNTWAPEIYYDDTTGEYIVFWASKLYENEAQRNSGATYNRMMYTKTRDFHTFTEPEIYIDYGYSVIDTTMLEHDGKIYRFHKDERNNSTEAPDGKYIFQDVGDSILDENFELIKRSVGRDYVGHTEGPIIFKSNTEEKWYLFVDEFAQRGYVPLESTDLDSGEWTEPSSYSFPSGIRHGSVLPVTKAEHERLMENVPSVEEPSTEITVTGVTLNEETVTLSAGEEVELVATVTPEDAENKHVTWSSSDEDVAVVDENGKVTALREGSVYITVTTVNGGYMAVSSVTVEGEVIPEVNTEELESLLDTAKAYTNEGEYTEESFASLQSGIAEAEETLANEEVTQEDIDAAVTALQAAIDQLEAATDPDPVLKDGYTGEEVVTLKQNLSQLGFGNFPASPSERFGPVTESVVRSFQHYFGLEATGMAGEETLSLIDEILNSIYTDGNTAPEIRDLKLDLTLLGFGNFPMDPSENYGPVTMGVVSDFQAANQLVVSGIADPVTLALLAEQVDALTLDVPYKDGDTGQEIVTLKENLTLLGFGNFPTLPSEHFGPVTESVVVAFQNYFGLDVSGEADQTTLDLIDEILNGIYTDGNSASEIRDLKLDLTLLGYGNFPTDPSENYGPVTMGVVRAYQEANDLVVSGIADPVTLALLAEQVDEIKLDVPYKDGDVGYEIFLLKLNLTQLGFGNFPSSPSDVYGPVTEAVVSSFQVYFDLEVTREANQETLDLMDEILNSVYTDGKSAPEVKDMKLKLTSLGYGNFPSDPSENYGPVTMGVVRDFQQANDLIVSGIADYVTLAKLDSLSE
ncbi:immunoglobulin-like domain-containing protein [Salipaludibacillus sp. HK11]|uniref:immunoglobulin-like domain-containing protein n=1 Tax=Salipaludibacillus sp. HK11 TaxID=3394320 RepID=UPI0039FC0C91